MESAEEASDTKQIKLSDFWPQAPICGSLSLGRHFANHGVISELTSYCLLVGADLAETLLAVAPFDIAKQ